MPFILKQVGSEWIGTNRLCIVNNSIMGFGPLWFILHFIMAVSQPAVIGDPKGGAQLAQRCPG
jgi:hypothetical protein